MGNNKSRRDFLSIFIQPDKNISDEPKVKMLTADGKLVEIDKAVFEKASKKQKATNKDIYDWMENPSKKND
jgi:hypothetical protein